MVWVTATRQTRCCTWTRDVFVHLTRDHDPNHAPPRVRGCGKPLRQRRRFSRHLLPTTSRAQCTSTACCFFTLLQTSTGDPAVRGFPHTHMPAAALSTDTAAP